MLTTVVGSYPAFPQEPSSIASRVSNVLGIYDPYNYAVELAVKDQIRAGVDIISDGQVRGDMLAIFAQVIPGMVVEDRTPKIREKIKPLPYSIGASDLNYALKIANSTSSEFKNSEKEIISQKEFKKDVKGVKGIITGPNTLAYASRIEGFYDPDKKEEVIIDLAWALKKEAEYLQNSGAVVIQIDEPFLSTGIVDIKTAKKAVEIIVRNLSLPVAMHVCGDVVNVFEELLRFKVDILDCEFAGQPKNLEALENTVLRGKKIGLGTIDTKTDEIETKEQAAEIIKKGADMVGEENLMVDPDCGMRNRSRDAAFSKLKVMVEAVKWLS
jgi:5-methyltetrahydropteroyltriglutamate--homocysteine methyltransferase